jgi:MEMO1 family protein
LIRVMVGEDIYFPGDPDVLRHNLQQAFRESPVISEGAAVTIAPFGAYRHSLPYIAGSLKAMGTKRPDRIIILAPPDSNSAGDVMLPESDRFATPLGTLPVETDTLEKLRRRSRYFVNDEIAHLQNHSIEVLLPAVQYYFGSVPILPLLVPRLTIDQLTPVTDAIASIQIPGETRILVGANLSGFAPPREAEGTARMMIRLLMTARGTGITENIATFESPPRSAWPLALGHILAGETTRPHILSRGNFETEYEGNAGTVVFASIAYIRG